MEITYGSANQVNASSNGVNVLALTDTKCIYFTSGGYRVGTVSGTTVSMGSSYGNADGVAGGIVVMVKLSDTSFATIYQTSSFNLHIAYATVSGTVITVNAGVQIRAGGVTNISATAISSTVVVAAYTVGSNSYVRSMYQSSTTFTGYASETTYSFSAISSHIIERIDSTSFALLSRESGGNTTVYRYVLSGTYLEGISDTHSSTMETNQTISFYSAKNYTDNYILFAYTNGSVYTNYVRVVNITSSGITIGTAASLGSGSFISSIMFSTTKGACIYGATYPTSLNSKVFDIIGTTITLDSTAYSFSGLMDGAKLYMSSMSATKFSTAYIDRNSPYYAKTIIGTIPASGKKINGVFIVKFNSTTISKWNTI